MKTIIYKRDYQDCLDYINRYWEKLICFHPKDRMINLGLPNPYVSPSAGIFKKDQFYWDTYFIILGLVKCDRVKLAKGMVDNLCFLFRRFNIVPMRNRYYNIGISQIPFLTSMALEIYEKYKNNKWLLKTGEVAEDELANYWMNSKLTEKHIVHKGLSRYCDHFITHLGAEHESGWDMTSRFKDNCLNYLPVDLNTCLYKYELDISAIQKINQNSIKEKNYLDNARRRKKIITQLMWNERKGFFFDYNCKTKKQSNFYSLAGYYPLWAGLATKSQAEKVKDQLALFEYKGGLSNTQSENLSEEFKQHDYPNGWAQQHYIVIQGLLNYGYEEEAKRIAKKWLELNKKVFIKTGNFWEKYNVVKCTVGKSNQDRYPIQSGFGWTNAIFVKLIEELSE